MNIRRHFSRRRVLALGAVAAAALSIGVTAVPAQAAITHMTAALSCSSGTVRAYPPSAYTTRGTNAWANLATKADVYAYTNQGWKYVGTSGWWAKGATNAKGYLGSMNGSYWLKNNGYGALFMPFTVTPGYYYSVVTYVQDMTDGKITWVNNQLDASNPNSAKNCLA